MISRKSFILLIYILLISISVFAKEIRALWVMPWNLTNTAQIDILVADAVENNQNEILAEVRYRADALYIPNKHNSHYNNPEPRSYILKNDDFDPLEYLITEAHAHGIEVQAWLSVLNVTPTNSERLRTNFIFQNHYDWIMTDSHGSKMNGSNYMGNFIDPGILEVKNHLLNVMLDIVSNYPALDGIHLDYIRYPAQQFGHSTESVRRFKEANQKNKLSWNEWRISQVTELIKEFKDRAKVINPELIVSAAVIADLNEARIHYAQDWVSWINTGLIDRVYPMAYAKDYNNFYNVIYNIAEVTPKEKVVIGLRAWQENFPRVDYRVERIIEKAKLSQQMEFGGLAFFSYEGLKNTGMFPELTLALYNWQGMDFDINSEDSFISKITSQYRYNGDQDSTVVVPVKNKPRTAEIQYDSSEQAKFTKPLAYFDSILVKGSVYYLTFYFDKERNWKWEISDANNDVIFQKKHLYPRGYYTEEWNGNNKEGNAITNGIYTLRVKDSRDKIVNEKKFIVY